MNAPQPNVVGPDLGSREQRLRLFCHRSSCIRTATVKATSLVMAVSNALSSPTRLSSYRHWEERPRRTDFVAGQFGENFTAKCLTDDVVCIGDRYRIDSARFEVTQPSGPSRPPGNWTERRYLGRYRAETSSWKGLSSSRRGNALSHRASLRAFAAGLRSRVEASRSPGPRGGRRTLCRRDPPAQVGRRRVSGRCLRSPHPLQHAGHLLPLPGARRLKLQPDRRPRISFLRRLVTYTRNGAGL